MTMQHVSTSYDGGIQWAVKRNDVGDQPAYHEFKSEAEARQFYNSSMRLAELHLPDMPERWPELVATQITWQVQQ